MNAEQLVRNVESHCESKLTEAFNDKARWQLKYGEKLPKWAEEKLQVQADEVNAFKALIQVIRALQKEVEFHDLDKSFDRVKEKKWYKVLNRERDFRDTIIEEIDLHFKDLVSDLNHQANKKLKLFKVYTVGMKHSIGIIKEQLAKYHKIRQDNKKTLFD